MIPMGDKFPDGKQNTGWLIPRNMVLFSPFVMARKRWFPVLSEYEVRTN
jgi:hypothetical protein